MNAQVPEQPLDLLCPCGYTKKIPSKYDGQKIVCPKCRRVLRIEKIRLLAELLVRCPYCKSTQQYDNEVINCSSCKREFDYPKFAMNSDAPPLDSSSKNPEPGVEIKVGSSNSKIAVRPKRKRKTNSAIRKMTSALSFFLPTVLIVAIWHLYGDRLDLPQLRIFGNRQQVTVATNEIELQSNYINKNTSPKLLSPSVRIAEVGFSYDQALNVVTSKVDGVKLFVDVKVQNLTACQIDNIIFTVRVSSASKKTQKLKVERELAETLGPYSTREFTLVVDSGNWDSGTVSVTHVGAGTQHDRTNIGPVNIFAASDNKLPSLRSD